MEDEKKMTGQKPLTTKETPPSSVQDVAISPQTSAIQTQEIFKSKQVEENYKKIIRWLVGPEPMWVLPAVDLIAAATVPPLPDSITLKK